MRCSYLAVRKVSTRIMMAGLAHPNGTNGISVRRASKASVGNEEPMRELRQIGTAGLAGHSMPAMASI